MTIKFSPDGDTLWIARYAGSEDLAATAAALALDSLGNVYVTGTCGHSWDPVGGEGFPSPTGPLPR